MEGSGGHQDNVFEEMDTMCNWWKEFKKKENTDDILVILIDTDLTSKFNRLKNKYSDIANIKVCNHIGLQQYIIDTFYSCESM